MLGTSGLPTPGRIVPHIHHLFLFLNNILVLHAFLPFAQSAHYFLNSHLLFLSLRKLFNSALFISVNGPWLFRNNKIRLLWILFLFILFLDQLSSFIFSHLLFFLLLLLLFLFLEVKALLIVFQVLLYHIHIHPLDLQWIYKLLNIFSLL